MTDIVDVTGIQYGINQANTLFFLGGSDHLATLGNCDNDTVLISGASNSFSIGVNEMGASMANLVVDDLGVGSTLNLSFANNATVLGFGNDPTGSVVVNFQLTAPVISPDGHGGSLLSIAPTQYYGGRVVADFADDPNLTIAQVHGFAWS